MSVKLIVLIFALTITIIAANPAKNKKSNYIEQEKSCRQVCGLCDCDGFYCEDECICECNLEEDENLQCIADMKKECDANGLEYELIMQDSTKERFLRETKGSSFDLKKHLLNLKQKRNSDGEEPEVGAALPAQHEPIVAAPAPEEPEPVVGAPLTALSTSKTGLKALKALSGLGDLGLGGKSAASGKNLIAREGLENLSSSKLLVLLRERFNDPIEKAAIPAAPALPAFPALQKLAVLPPVADTPIVKPFADFGKISFASEAAEKAAVVSPFAGFGKAAAIPPPPAIKPFSLPALPVQPAHLFD